MAAFSGWNGLGLALPSRRQTSCLTADLVALGALYMLEGATLGGAMIVRDLEGRIGASIVWGTRFFGGRGEALWPMWHSFRRALDEFGCKQPQLRTEVVSGAERTFSALLLWFGAVAGVRS